MSHRTLSWILTLTAFLLFALACTLGRNAADEAPLSPQPATKNAPLVSVVNALNLQGTGFEKWFSNQAIRTCAMKEFYRENPALQGHLSNTLEAAIRVKMIDHLRAQMRNVPPRLKARLQKCLSQPGYQSPTVAATR